jgi:hypothetical protein
MYRILILLVLCGCETWSITLREKHRLRVLENRVLRRILGPKRDEVTGWRRLHNEELYAVCASANIVWMIILRRLRWAGHVAHMWERRASYRVLVAQEISGLLETRCLGHSKNESCNGPLIVTEFRNF